MSREKLPEYSIPKGLLSVLQTNVQKFEGVDREYEHYYDILKKLKMMIKENTQLQMGTYVHYLQLLKLGLYLEEYEESDIMDRYARSNTKLQRTHEKADVFKIYVYDLDKDNPIIKPADFVDLCESGTTDGSKFILKIANVLDDYVTVIGNETFCKSYRDSKTYDIKFLCNNYNYRCCHYAISSLKSFKLESVLFPTKKKSITIRSQCINQVWFNKSIENNPEQKQAVINITGKSPRPAPYILYGPPGTGKTATLVEAVCQIWKESYANVLICTPSNAACDVITKKLLKYIPTDHLYRVFSYAKEGSKIDQDIKECSNCKSGQAVSLRREMISSKRILITTMCICSKLSLLDLKLQYTYLFIDEAGQATEPEFLIPINFMNRCGTYSHQIVLSGDPKQLGPGIKSKLAEPIIGQSVLERYMKREPYRKDPEKGYDPRYITKLIRNYRSHPAIIHVSNELFYENELIACADVEIPIEGVPIVFHGVVGQEKKIANSKSTYNDEEITKVMDYVHSLLGKKFKNKVIGQEDIGIVTPFALQCVKFRRALRSRNFNDIVVGTVEVFQGQEKEIMILSTVRTKTFVHEERAHIGFLSNPRRFNVALTRAKSLLVVVGDPTALRTDKYWRYFLNFCRQNSACREVTDCEMSAESDDSSAIFQSETQDVDSTVWFSPVFTVLEIDDGKKPVKESRKQDPVMEYYLKDIKER